MHLLQRFPAGVIPQRVKRGRASTTNQESFFTPKMGVIIRKSYFESFWYKESWLQFLKIYKELQYLRQREVQTMVSSTKMAQTVKFSDEEIAEFKKFFSLSDEDGDGRITTKELGTLMRYVGLDSAEAEFHDMISNIDFPIDFLELLDLMSRNMKVVFGSATISYGYKYVSLNGSSSNTRTTLGNLSGTDDNVYVDFGSLSDADNFLHRFSHKNYLPVVLVDYEASCILHLPYSLPLVDHVKSLKLSNIFPIMTYNFLDETNSYEYVCETYRELSKSLIDFLLHLHTINKSLVHFSLDNLCIRDGVLNIWGVRFSEMDEKSRQQDFALASSVIKAIFALGGKEPQQKYPYDFHQFLLEMSDKKRRKDVIIENHFALLNAKERCQFAKNLRDVQEGFNVSDFKRYMSAARALKSNVGWIARLKTRAVKACLNYKKNKSYADKGSDDIVSSSLMRICRNTSTHTWGELYRYLSLQAPYPDSIQYKDIECIIMKEFGRVLTDFHVLLKMSGVGHFFDSF